MQKIHLTYNQLHEYSHKLISDIHKSDFRPTCVVAIAMGGLPIGYHLAKGLKIDKFYTIQIKSYKGTKQGEILDNSNNISDISGHKVLLVDDLVDSGNTAKYICNNYMKEVYDFCFATWIYKTHSVIKPDFFVQTYSNEWIVFPYEEFEKD